ncbi:Hypothetical predicted protein [Mytilus galloprovincialis]|uniref:SWIM-type domain-containing protein n=1 Tax=Mytilus galloprovincialis TaxID=29158 RepID=A0A8B6H921_MYTGA|nr:Hypothetical predicted protein [Mytilus galloprovincialis]
MEQFAKQLTVKEACKLILKGDKEDYVSSVPVDCIETSTFVIDTLALKDRDDLRIHMAGAMKNNRVQRDFVSVHISDGEISNISVLKKKPSVMRNSVYRLTRTYWMSKNTKGFKRRLYELHDSAGKPTRFAILQYVVEGDVPTTVYSRMYMVTQRRETRRTYVQIVYTDTDFENKLLELKPIWNLRECESRKNDGASVLYYWFLKYKKNLVQNCLLLPLRISYGFGFSHYTTNANESLNNRLKQKTDYQENEVTVFCTKTRELTDEQKKDTEKAIIGMGPYQIRTEYIEHVQPSHAWFKLSESSRSKHISAFLKAPLEPSQFRSSIRISVGEQPGTSGTSLDPQPHHKSLSISLEDIHLDPTIHEPIWKKAESLVNSGLVNKAPGVQNGFMVASTSGKDPHFVRLLESGKGTCNCENFKLLSICSHVLAACECGRKLQKLIKYLRKTRSAPNLQELSKVNMPKHPQRKPNQKPRSNKRKPTRDWFKA